MVSFSHHIEAALSPQDWRPEMLLAQTRSLQDDIMRALERRKSRRLEDALTECYNLMVRVATAAGKAERKRSRQSRKARRSGLQSFFSSLPVPASVAKRRAASNAAAARAQRLKAEERRNRKQRKRSVFMFGNLRRAISAGDGQVGDDEPAGSSTMF